jgi:hypothetical protein
MVLARVWEFCPFHDGGTVVTLTACGSTYASSVAKPHFHFVYFHWATRPVITLISYLLSEVIKVASESVSVPEFPTSPHALRDITTYWNSLVISSALRQVHFQSVHLRPENHFTKTTSTLITFSHTCPEGIWRVLEVQLYSSLHSATSVGEWLSLSKGEFYPWRKAFHRPVTMRLDSHKNKPNTRNVFHMHRSKYMADSRN